MLEIIRCTINRDRTHDLTLGLLEGNDRDKIKEHRGD